MPDSEAPLGLSVHGVTLGELNRNMHALRDELRSTRGELSKVHALSTTVEVTRERLDRLDEQVAGIEAGLVWLVRLVLGAVVLAIIATVIVTT